MKKSIIFITAFFAVIFFLTCIFTFVVYSGYSFTANSPVYYFSSDKYFWPMPGYYTISSTFGPRLSPTTGASSFHSGIDISAPEGSNIFAIFSGEVSYLDFERSKWLYFKNY